MSKTYEILIIIFKIQSHVDLPSSDFIQKETLAMLLMLLMAVTSMAGSDFLLKK